MNITSSLEELLSLQNMINESSLSLELKKILNEFIQLMMAQDGVVTAHQVTIKGIIQKSLKFA